MVQVGQAAEPYFFPIKAPWWGSWRARKKPFVMAWKCKGERLWDGKGIGEKGLRIIDYVYEEAEASQPPPPPHSIWVAAGLGNLELLRAWIEYDPQTVNQAHPQAMGATPLLLAAHQGQLEIVKYLITEAHANMNQGDTSNGDTPLIRAAGHSQLSVVKYLIAEAHADVSQADSKGNTPLITAAMNGALEVVKYLVAEAHADVNQAAGNGGTALMLAAYQGYIEVVKYLITEAHADVKKADSTGHTPLMLAANQGHLTVVRFLLQPG